MKLTKDCCCLIIIDIQEKLLPHISNHKLVKNNSGKLIDLFSSLEIPIFCSEQYPKGLGPTVKDLKKKLQTINAHFFEKTSFSCFNSSELKKKLKLLKIKQIVLVGIETHICVLQTAMDFLSKSFNVYVVKEAIGSRNKQHNNMGIQRMINDGVSLINSEMVFFELINDSNHKKFKELSKKFIK